MPSSKTSRRGSKPVRRDASPDRNTLARAAQIVDDYRIILEPDPDGGFIGSSVELPTVFGDAPTIESCVDATRKALLGAVVTMIELGERPPARGKRTAQVNVRLTPYEKLMLTEAARTTGQRISEFIRVAALERSKATG